MKTRFMWTLVNEGKCRRSAPRRYSSAVSSSTGFLGAIITYASSAQVPPGSTVRSRKATYFRFPPPHVTFISGHGTSRLWFYGWVNSSYSTGCPIWVDLEFECSAGLVGILQRRLGSWERWCNTPINVDPTQVHEQMGHHAYSLESILNKTSLIHGQKSQMLTPIAYVHSRSSRAALSSLWTF